MHVHAKSLQSRSALHMTQWAVAHHSPLSTGFSRQESRCHALLQGIFPTQGLKPAALTSPSLAGEFFTTSATWEASPQGRRTLKKRKSSWEGHQLLLEGVWSLSCFSRVRLFAILWTVAHQGPLSMELSKQEYWSGLHVLLQGIFLTQGLNPHLLCLLHWPAGSLPLVPLGKPEGVWKGGDIFLNRFCCSLFCFSRHSFIHSAN